MHLSDVCLKSVRRLTSVCLSVEYIGPNSRTERLRKTKIGTEVAHVTRDSDANFKVKRSKVILLLMSDVRDRQTDVRQKHRLMPPPYGVEA